MRNPFRGQAHKGHQVWTFPGYGVNPARGNGADLEPIPITPVHGQNWPGMQVQLSNGWQSTNYGKKLSYDDYLRMLSTSTSEAGNTQVLPGGGPKKGTSPANYQDWLQNGPGNQPSVVGGPGSVAPGVDISGRGFYG